MLAKWNLLDSLIILIFGSLCLGVLSCYEPVEGCLDARAVNFDFSADNDCEDCCQYPFLTINLDHVFGDEAFYLDSIYTNNLGNQLIVTGHFFIVSDVELKSVLGEWVSVADSIDLICTVNGITQMARYSNTIACADPATNAISLMDWRQSGQFDSLIFHVGLDPCLSDIDTSSLLEAPELLDIISEKQPENVPGVVVQQFYLVSPDSITDTIGINIQGVSGFQNLGFSISKSNANGKGLGINLVIDYQIWLKDLDLKADSPDVIRSKLLLNSLQAFSVN